jgi:DNA-directed RNA polymerase specialized sigma subunit
VYEELNYYCVPEYYEKEPDILLDDLDDVSRYILENYYGKHLTLKDISKELGVSVNTVVAWRSKALLRLKD